MICLTIILCSADKIMKVTITKIWVAAALLALIGIAQVQSAGDSGAEVGSQLKNSNPYLTAFQK